MAPKYRFTVPDDYKIPGKVNVKSAELLLDAISIQAVKDAIYTSGNMQETALLWLSAMPRLEKRVKEELERKSNGEELSEMCLKLIMAEEKGEECISNAI